MLPRQVQLPSGSWEINDGIVCQEEVFTGKGRLILNEFDASLFYAMVQKGDTQLALSTAERAYLKKPKDSEKL